MLKSVILGLLLGIAVSTINYSITMIVTKNINPNNIQYKKKRMMFSIYLRFMINFLVLFIVHKNIPMLIATALGLTFIKNVLFIKYLFCKKGVSQ